MENLMFRIRATGTKIELVEKRGFLTSGMIGATLQIDYDDNWKALRKTAVFRAGNVTRDVYNVGYMIRIPTEVLTSYGLALEFGLFGEDDADHLVIPTVWLTLDSIRPGADPSGEEAYEPLPSLWQQVTRQIGDLSKLSTTAKESLVAAINEAAQSGGGTVSEEEVLQIVEKFLQEQIPDGDPIQVNAGAKIFISMSKNDVGHISFVASPQNQSDIFISVNGRSPDISSYTHPGSDTIFVGGQVGCCGKNAEAIVDGALRFHGSDLHLVSQDIRGDDLGCGRSFMVWKNLRSVNSISISVPGTLVAIGMAVKLLQKTNAGFIFAEIRDGALVVTGDITAKIANNILMIDGGITASVADNVLYIKEGTA